MSNQHNIENENIKFARYIYAIGGAGKNLIYTMLEKEWILQEILKPRHTSVECDITIIDTALDEENDDRDKIEKINSSIKEIETKNRNNPDYLTKNAGRINITYMLLTKDMILQSPHDLIGIEKAVKEATGAPVWWLNDPVLGPDWHNKVMNKENFKEMNFAKGVYRKRAIGKAIYYKALSKGMFNVGLLETAQIDIIVGLGGGTGSGMAFDLAKKLKSIRPTAEITLFGVLSTLYESRDEKANSFAMLSEIEYDHLNGDNLFKDIVLIPMEVTQFPGLERCDSIKKRLLTEFDETFPYMLISYHNNPSQELLADLPEYAPFIIMTSQMVRYNVKAIKKLKENVDESLINKELSLKSEKSVYDSINKYIDDYYKDKINQPNQLSDEDRQFIKDDRFAKFEMVSGHQFFKELEYDSVKYMAGDIKTGIASAGEDIEKQISSIKSEVDANVSVKTYRDSTDEQLYKVLKDDIEMIETIINTLSSINKIPDKIIVDTLKAIVKIDEESIGRMLNKIREKTINLNSEKSSHDRSIKSLNDEMKNYKEKISNDVVTRVQKWKQDETRNIENLDSIDNSISALNNDFMNLKNSLIEFVTSLIKENNIKAIDAKNTRDIEIILDKIYQDLEKIGIYYQDKPLIIKSITVLKELRKAQIESKKKIGTLDKILKTERVKKTKEAKSKVMLKIAELTEYRVFTAKDSSIHCSYEYDIVKTINDKKEEIISKIIKRTKDDFQNASPPLFSGLKSTLENSERRKDAGEDIKVITLSHLGYEVDINRTQQELKEKTANLIEISKNVNTLQALDTLITKTLKDDLGKHSGYLKKYHDTIENIKKHVQDMRDSKKDEVRYIMEIQPENIYKATARGSNINNILQDAQEKITMKQLLKAATNRTMDNNYNMLVQSVIENADYTKRWENTKIVNSLVTIANTIDPIFVDARTSILNTFSIDSMKYSDPVNRFGEQWEVGITLVIAGVPLDNIRSITDTRAGYYKSYNEKAATHKAFFHHSYNLENGKFIRRKKTFNFAEETDKKLLLESGTDEDIKQAFADNYEEVDIKTSL